MVGKYRQYPMLHVNVRQETLDDLDYVVNSANAVTRSEIVRECLRRWLPLYCADNNIPWPPPLGPRMAPPTRVGSQP